MKIKSLLIGMLASVALVGCTDEGLENGAENNKQPELVRGDAYVSFVINTSTNSSRAKAIVHTVRSFITIGRCHDTDVQKSASMKDFTIQAQIPTHSNTDIIASISDSLMQGSRLALEPIYDKDFFEIEVWRGVAEVCAETCSINELISIQGRIQSSTYTASDGKEYITYKFIGEKVSFLH